MYLQKLAKRHTCNDISKVIFFQLGALVHTIFIDLLKEDLNLGTADYLFCFGLHFDALKNTYLCPGNKSKLANAIFDERFLKSIELQ